jgi:hypothetical protein
MDSAMDQFALRVDSAGEMILRHTCGETIDLPPHQPNLARVIVLADEHLLGHLIREV